MPYLRNKSKIIKIMKTKETKTQLVRVLMVSIAICFSFIPNCYSYVHETTPITIDGKWATNPDDDLIENSLPIFPITAFLWDNYISIQNEKPDCDITINIINCTTGDIAYQQTVSKAATSNILIPVNNFASGEYILELTDLKTRHLEGHFSM